MEGYIFAQLKRVFRSTTGGILDRPTLGQCWQYRSLGTVANQALIDPVVCEEFIWCVPVIEKKGTLASYEKKINNRR
jgi:hypothetical protein